MRRLARSDLALLGAFAPIWLAALLLHAGLVLDGRLAWVPIYVEPASHAGAVPELHSLWPDTPPGATTLEPGDLLLAAGATDLRGAGRVDVLAAAYAEADGGTVRFTVQRGDLRRDALLQLQPFSVAWLALPVIAGVGASAIVALLRGKSRRAARAYAGSAFAYALTRSLLLGGPPWETRAALVLLALGTALFPPLTLRALLAFPAPGVRSRLASLSPWAFAVVAPLTLSWLIGWPLPGPLGTRLLFMVYVVLFATLLGVVAWRYRGADAAGRRQLRWVLLGFYLTLAPILGAALLTALRPELWRIYELSLVAALALPLFIGVALVRENLFDVDRLISSTAVYTLLSVLFVTALLTVVPRAADAAGRWMNLDPDRAQVGLALAVAAVLVPAGRWLRPRLEHLIFRERWAAERGMRALRAELGSHPDPASLLEAVGARLADLLAIDTCAIYVKSGDLFAPLFARGAAIPPAFAADSLLVGLLDRSEGPVEVARWWQRSRRGLGADDAALESLDARVLVPIRRGPELAAFVCLGAKRSEDVYTDVELHLLDGISERIGVELLHFDARAIERAERERYERLVGYVPAAVRAEIERRGLEPGEQEVSVLFVDIRGYTGFSESRRAGEVFRVVNAYTIACSEIVRRHGGQVVEFHGDGLLAVFGAPAHLVDKERAAVETALALVDTVDAGRIEALRGLDLSVGVGVATGETYVGNVESADRKIWTVIGNTTNLAARLQALTRDLGVSVVVDQTTHARAGDAGGGFARRDAVHVRGRSEPLELYVWSRHPAASAA